MFALPSVYDAFVRLLYHMQSKLSNIKAHFKFCIWQKIATLFGSRHYTGNILLHCKNRWIELFCT